jgi:hypothetical protein
MKRHTLMELSAAGAAAETNRGLGKARHSTRRQFLSGTRNVIAVAALTSTTANILAPNAAFASSSDKDNALTPEIQLVDDYNAWFYATIGGVIAVDKIRAAMPSYITNETVLYEALSLPWGGTTVGYDGWIHLCQISAPISERLGPHLIVSDAQYTQRDNIVFRESTMTIKPTKAAPTPFILPIIEKYRIANARIGQIDSYFQDTAGFLKRLTILGVLPKRR